MAKVFLSYAEEDTDWADKLVVELSYRGIEYYNFQDYQRKGERFIKASEQALIGDCDAFIALVSEHYMQSFWCELEKGVALRRQKVQGNFIQVVKVGEIDDIDLGYLGEFTRFDFTAGQFDDQVQEMLNRIEEKEEVVQPLFIPVAVYAMTSQEHEQFVETITDLDELLEEFSNYGVTDLADCYGKLRHEWRPLLGLNGTIEEIVQEIIDHENDSSDHNRPVQPLFYSEELFSDDENIRHRARMEFIRRNGILIIDVVSLLYDDLRNKLEASSCWGLNTAIMMVHPLGVEQFEIGNLVLGEDGILSQPMFEMPLGRFSRDYEAGCDLSVSDMWSVKRWLAQTVPETRKGLLSLQAVRERRNSVRKIDTPGKGIGRLALEGGR